MIVQWKTKWNSPSPRLIGATLGRVGTSSVYFYPPPPVGGDVHTDFGEICQICSHVLVSGSKIMGAGEPKDPRNERIGIVAFWNMSVHRNRTRTRSVKDGNKNKIFWKFWICWWSETGTQQILFISVYKRMIKNIATWFGDFFYTYFPASSDPLNWYT